MKKKRDLNTSPKYDFSGGLVTMVAKTRLQPNQLIKAKNINILIDGEVEVRGGCAKISTVPFGTIIDRFIHFKTDSYDKIIGYGGTYVKRLDVGSPDVWTPLSDTMPDTEDYRSMEIAQNMLYIARGDAVNAVRKYYPTKTVLWLAGIVAPSNKVTSTEGTSGNLLGTYNWYYTYYNSITQEESNPSLISDPPLTITAPAKRVTLSGFTQSGDAQVDKIRIYRNSNGVTDYFYVGEKANTTDSFEDNIHDDNLGAAMSILNDAPPKSNLLLWHLNRMFYVDADNPSDVYFSEPFKPGSVPPVNKMSIERGDGGRIVRLISCYDNIVVLKNTGVYLLVFNANSPLESIYQPVATKYGCVAPISAQNIREVIVFLSPEGLKKIINGGTTIDDLAIPVVSDYGTKNLNAIANLLRSCPKEYIGKAVSIYYEDKNQYHLSVPYNSANNDLTVVWNLDSNTFALHDGWNVKACAPYRYYDSEQLYRSHGDEYIYKHDTGSLDVATPITFEWQTGWHDVNGIPDRKRIRLFFPVIFGGSGAEINYEILKDFESPGSGFMGTIVHTGASWFGYSYWGNSYWGQGGEILYRKKTLVKGKLFSVRFYGITSHAVGVAGYQFFYQPKEL